LFGVLIGVVAGMAHAAGVTAEAGTDGPAQTAYAPASGKGPIAVVISGQSGPNSYQAYAAELAKLGYYAVLLDGKDILNPALTGTATLKTAIERAQRSPAAAPGKAAVIGFSLGGGGALYSAAPVIQPGIRRARRAAARLSPRRRSGCVAPNPRDAEAVSAARQLSHGVTGRIVAAAGVTRAQSWRAGRPCRNGSRGHLSRQDMQRQTGRPGSAPAAPQCVAARAPSYVARSWKTESIDGLQAN
jgi:hypothetical protein